MHSIPAYDCDGRPERIKGRAIGSSKLVVKFGDVLFSKLNPRIPRAWIVDAKEDLPLVASTEFIRLHPSEQVDLHFLRYLLISEPFLRQVRGDALGATGSRQRVRGENVLDATIPLPPMEEQRRIVAKIEALLARVGEARSLRDKAREDATNLVESALREAFQASCEWPSHPLKDVIAVEAPLVDPRLPEYRPLPHISGSAMESVTGRLLPYRTADEDEVISSKFLFSPGDVLYSKIRPYLRKAALVRFTGLCSADVYPVRVTDRQLLTPEFLRWALVAPPFTAYAVDASKRARMPKLNREQLFSYEMGIPSLAEQDRIVRFLGSIEVHSQELRAIQEITDTELQRLEQSILDRAFRGEL